MKSTNAVATFFAPCMFGITAVHPFRCSGEWICGRPSSEWRPNRAHYARNRALVYNAADRIPLDDAELRYDTQLHSDRSLFFVATGAVRQPGDDRRWKQTAHADP